MDIYWLVAEIDAEITRLERAKTLLTESFGGSRKVGRLRSGRRVLSAEAKERIAAVQRARSAKARKGAKKAPPTPARG